MSDVKQLKIETYNLVDFVLQVQEAVLNGYTVNDSSDDAPMCIGNCYHVIMREAKPAKGVEKIVNTLVVEASIDTTKLQEQLKAGGEIEQMLADSLVVDEMSTANDFLIVSDDIDEALSSGVVEDVKIEEKLSTEEFSALADKAANLIDKVDNLLVEAEAKHIEATTPVKATPKQTRGKK